MSTLLLPLRSASILLALVLSCSLANTAELAALPRDAVAGVLETQDKPGPMTGNDVANFNKMEWYAKAIAMPDMENRHPRVQDTRVQDITLMIAALRDFGSPDNWTLTVKAVDPTAKAAELAKAADRFQTMRETMMIVKEQFEQVLEKKRSQEVGVDDHLILNQPGLLVGGIGGTAIRIPVKTRAGRTENFQVHLIAFDATKKLWLTDHTDEQLANLRIAAEKMQFLSQRLGSEVNAENLAAFKVGLTGWTNYLESGYPQYPWELIVNDFAHGDSIKSPPRVQWVILHPEVGFSFPSTTLADAKPVTTIMFHSGFVYYGGDARDWYLGPAVTVPFNDDYGMGYGFTLLSGGKTLSSYLPPISIGIHFYDMNDDGRIGSYDYNHPSIAVGVDLAALLFKNKLPKWVTTEGGSK